VIGFPQNIPGTVLRALVVVLAAYTVAMLTRKYLELPFLRMRPGEPNRQLPEREAALAAAR
jgi:hypothetical protein